MVDRRSEKTTSERQVSAKLACRKKNESVSSETARLRNFGFERSGSRVNPPSNRTNWELPKGSVPLRVISATIASMVGSPKLKIERERGRERGKVYRFSRVAVCSLGGKERTMGTQTANGNLRKSDVRIFSSSRSLMILQHDLSSCPMDLPHSQR